jgi:DNA-binding CsgD family transcriptional regulator
LIAGAIEAFSFEAVYRHADGRRLEARTSVAIHVDPSGEPEYFVAEITARAPSDAPTSAPSVVLDAHRAEDLARAAAMRTARARVVERYSLTERDDELLDLLLRGHRVASIASEMFLASGTVRNNLSTLYHRVGVTGQAELLEMLHDLADRVMGESDA